VPPGEPERAGRWWWEQYTDKECGIHCSVQLFGTKSDGEREAERAGVREEAS
jgi:3'-phosphoadenosine 5'-phosphosulfate sulfotransferase (PAPS reductase)/FAD synthetase